MKQLRTLHCIILLTALAATASHAADRVPAVPAMNRTSVIVLPQVVIVGKRLDPVEKSRLAQASQQERTTRLTVIADHKS